MFVASLCNRNDTREAVILLDAKGSEAAIEETYRLMDERSFSHAGLFEIGRGYTVLLLIIDDQSRSVTRV
jgi:hypothetical protein